MICFCDNRPGPTLECAIMTISGTACKVEMDDYSSDYTLHVSAHRSTGMKSYLQDTTAETSYCRRLGRLTKFERCQNTNRRNHQQSIRDEVH